MAHTIDCVCSKISNHGLNHGLLFSLQVFWVKKHSALAWKVGIKISIPILFEILFLLDIEANLSETRSFFVCPNGFGEHLLANVYSTWDVLLCVWVWSVCRPLGLVFLRRNPNIAPQQSASTHYSKTDLAKWQAIPTSTNDISSLVINLFQTLIYVR